MENIARKCAPDPNHWKTFHPLHLREAGPVSGPLRLHADSNKCPGTYTLHCYCKWVNPGHRFDEFPHHFYGVETGGQARSEARLSGWIIHKDGTGTCPKCAKVPRTAAAEPAVRWG